MGLKIGTRVRIKKGCALYSYSKEVTGTITRFSRAEPDWFIVKWNNGETYWYLPNFVEIAELVDSGQLMLIQEE